MFNPCSVSGHGHSAGSMPLKPLVGQDIIVGAHSEVNLLSSWDQEVKGDRTGTWMNVACWLTLWLTHCLFLTFLPSLGPPARKWCPLYTGPSYIKTVEAVPHKHVHRLIWWQLFSWDFHQAILSCSGWQLMPIQTKAWGRTPVPQLLSTRLCLLKASPHCTNAV